MGNIGIHVIWTLPWWVSNINTVSWRGQSGAATDAVAAW